MELTEMTALLSNFAFPVVMCIALFYYMVTTNKQHQEETNGLKDAIQNLEIAITKLCERFEK